MQHNHSWITRSKSGECNTSCETDKSVLQLMSLNNFHMIIYTKGYYIYLGQWVSLQAYWMEPVQFGECIYPNTLQDETTFFLIT